MKSDKWKDKKGTSNGNEVGFNERTRNGLQTVLKPD